MANEFQISSLTELFDSFGDSTLYKLYPQQQKSDACDEIMTVEQHNQSNTTFSKTVICAGVTSMVLVVYGKNIVMV